MSRIFISYRREDTGMGVGRLTDALREHFASDQIFQDIDSIDPGADFIDALQLALADCAAVLVVIGPKWLSVADRQGRRRLDKADDWVRQEIAEVLRRPGLGIFPLLVDGAEMPVAEDLPEAIKPLARRQAYELTLRHWSKDISLLIETLRRIPSLSTATLVLEETVASPERVTVAQKPEAFPQTRETGGAHNIPETGSSARKRLTLVGVALAALLAIWFGAGKMWGSSALEVPVVEAPSIPAAPDSATQPKPALPTISSTGPKAASASFTGEMVQLPGECFEMGSPIGEAGRDDDERQHQVCVEAFAIGKTEVTQAQWQSVMGNNPSEFKCGGCPVEQISWTDAMAFVAKLNASTGQRYRLPTEAEWEYACRGGSPGERYCGGERLDSVAWANGIIDDSTHPVGQKAANGFGLYDMSGNVWEWTCSGYDEAYIGGERQCSNNASEYVTRGGGWFSISRNSRSASRFVDKLGERKSIQGFRLARTVR